MFSRRSFCWLRIKINKLSLVFSLDAAADQWAPVVCLVDLIKEASVCYTIVQRKLCPRLVRLTVFVAFSVISAFEVGVDSHYVGVHLEHLKDKPSFSF